MHWSLPASHESSVQSTPSPHEGAGPDTQSLTASQDSGPLQKTPSSGQWALLGIFAHRLLPASHESSVQSTPSSQVGASPDTQSLTASQDSGPSQNVPLSQLPLLGMCTHRSLPASHESSVQSTPSSQVGTGPDTQSLTASQDSGPLQKTPSSGQLSLLAMCTHWSLPASHESSVQSTPSSQVGTGPDTQSLTASQDSGPLQKTPSSGQLSLLGMCTHRSLPASHESSVQSTPSSQLGASPV